MAIPSLLDREGFIWIDGEYFPWQEAKVHVLTQTFHYGFGAFEGLRSYQTADSIAIFRLQEHTERLFHSAKTLNIEIPYSKEKLNQLQCEILQKNNFKNAYIRPMVFLGGEFLGLNSQTNSVHVMIVAWDWGNMYMSKDKFEKGISVKISSYSRTDARNGLNKVKVNGNYLLSILAINEARYAGYDDTLMLDNEGFIAEGGGANIFMVKDDVLYTPDLTAALDGITRRTVIEIAKKLGMIVIEKRITRDEIYNADETFFTGTAAEILPITTIDNRKIAAGYTGSITKKLQDHYSAIVTGQMPQYQHWLTLVESKQKEICSLD